MSQQPESFPGGPRYTPPWRQVFLLSRVTGSHVGGREQLPRGGDVSPGRPLSWAQMRTRAGCSSQGCRGGPAPATPSHTGVLSVAVSEPQACDRRPAGFLCMPWPGPPSTPWGPAHPQTPPGHRHICFLWRVFFSISTQLNALISP